MLTGECVLVAVVLLQWIECFIGFKKIIHYTLTNWWHQLLLHGNTTFYFAMSLLLKHRSCYTK